MNSGVIQTLCWNRVKMNLRSVTKTEFSLSMVNERFCKVLTVLICDELNHVCMFSLNLSPQLCGHILNELMLSTYLVWIYYTYIYMVSQKKHFPVHQWPTCISFHLPQHIKHYWHSDTGCIKQCPLNKSPL